MSKVNIEKIEKAGYKILRNGDILSKDNKVMSPGIIKRGYKSYRLYLHGTKKSLLGHRLVASKYIPNPRNKPQVNHIDSDKLNNDVSNLEWCTARENTQHAIMAGTRNTDVQNKANREAHNKPVLNLITRVIYISAKDASNVLNLNYGTLVSRLNGRARNNTNLVYINEEV